MSYREYKGNLFLSNAQALVNTVNCVGVMGKGIALEFRRRFPAMFEEYRRVCNTGRLRPGEILPFREGHRWILNFAVKDHWRYPSKVEWVERCLQEFAQSYQHLDIRSVALPWIGAMNGRLPWNRVQELMRAYLMDLPGIDVEVVEFDPLTADPLFHNLEQALRLFDARSLSREASLSAKVVERIYQAVCSQEVRSLSELIDKVPMGQVSVDNLYRFLVKYRTETVPQTAKQLSLFE